MYLKTKIKELPEKPGCYIYKNHKGIIIYIGKAKNLKKRVSSYFSNKNLDIKTEHLVENIAEMDYIITINETEAFILENNLIKKHKPKYNINLKDNKRYAYLRLTKEDFPKLEIARTKVKKGDYFGPFVCAENRDLVKETVIRTFKLRTCNKFPKKECLRHHINLCDAPCVNHISKKEYNEKILEAKMVLRGQSKDLIHKLDEEMKIASIEGDFERALILRDRIKALMWLTEKQNAERMKNYDEDIINFIIDKSKVYLYVFNVSQGCLENKQEFEFDYSKDFLDEFLNRFYYDNKVPKEIIIPRLPDPSLIRFFEEKYNARIITPKQGEKKELLQLVKHNIEVNVFGKRHKALENLKEILRLDSIPQRIECFDISHLSGSHTVASMVHFFYGKPDKSNYRRFKIRTVEGIDDTASVAEVVYRRYRRLKQNNKKMPDLIVIDGGKGQLSAARQELNKLDLDIPLISLAKRFEEIYTIGRKTPIKLDKKNDALNLLQHIRDEAHRFAIKYNRLLRSKAYKE